MIELAANAQLPLPLRHAIGATVGVFVVPRLLFGPRALDLDNGRADASVAPGRCARPRKILELFSDFSRGELGEIEMQLLVAQQILVALGGGTAVLELVPRETFIDTAPD